MKKQVRKLSDEELEKYPIRDLVEGWFVRIIETSQGAYQVEGVDRWGRKVSRSGIDPDQLLSLCKKDIEEMISS